MRDEPTPIPDQAWDHPDTRAALDNRDIPAIIRFAGKYGWTQARIALGAQMADSEISKIANGRRAATDLDVFTRIANGVAMPDRARCRLGIAPANPPVDPSSVWGAQSAQTWAHPAGGRPTDSATREVDDTDRRRLLRAGGLATAGIAASLSDAIARADPTPRTLREISADIRRLASDYRKVANSELIPRVEDAWLGVERLLDSPVSSRARPRLVTCAGQYAFYLAKLAFDSGDDDGAVAFLSLAEQRAAESRDPLLIGSVAALESGFAHFNGDQASAADIAAAARPGAHPFVIPKLASNEARAAAMAGQPERSRRALGDMQDHVWSGGVLPGCEMIDEEAVHCYLAAVGSMLGDGEAAEVHARRSLDLLSGTDDFGAASGSYSVLGLSFLHRRNPDPEQAADAGLQALAVVKGRARRSDVQNAGDLWRDLNARWPDLPAVRDLCDLVVEARRALPHAVA